MRLHTHSGCFLDISSKSLRFLMILAENEVKSLVRCFYSFTQAQAQTLAVAFVLVFTQKLIFINDEVKKLFQLQDVAYHPSSFSVSQNAQNISERVPK